MHPELVGLQDDMLVRRMVRLRALLPGLLLRPAVCMSAHQIYYSCKLLSVNALLA